MITDAQVLTSFVRDRDVPCPKCKYNLRDNASTICPECGTGLTIQPTRRCVRCRYDLKGLSPDGLCPECGMSVERSLALDRLYLADPAWLARLARGQTLIAGGLCLLLSGMVLAVFSLVVRAGHGSTSTDPIVATMVLCSGMILSAAALLATGVLLTTAQDPSMRGFERMFSARVLARAGLVAHVAFIGLAFAIDALPLSFLTRVPVRTVLLLLAVASATISIVSLLKWIGSRAMLIPARKLGRRAYGAGAEMAWALPLFLGGLVVAAAPVRRLAAPGSSLDVDPLNLVLGCSSPCAGFVLLLLLARFLAVVFGCQRAFRSCYKQARGLARSEPTAEDRPDAAVVSAQCWPRRSQCVMMPACKCP